MASSRAWSFLSVQGAESNPIVPHHRIERAICDLGLPYTLLRPSFFMQNLTTTHLPEIRDEHRDVLTGWEAQPEARAAWE